MNSENFFICGLIIRLNSGVSVMLEYPKIRPKYNFRNVSNLANLAKILGIHPSY